MNNNNDNHPTTFRFELSGNVSSEVKTFSKIHEHDERKEYKKAWKDWCEEHNELINEERRRLAEEGYEGDVVDKMFTAGRYYFRKKNLRQEQGQAEEQAQGQRKRSYITMMTGTLDAMDNHIKTCINDNDFKPAVAYNNFCQLNSQLLIDERENLSHHLNGKDVELKIKKTYKNRYFRVSRGK